MDEEILKKKRGPKQKGGEMTCCGQTAEESCIVKGCRCYTVMHEIKVLYVSE